MIEVPEHVRIEEVNMEKMSRLMSQLLDSTKTLRQNIWHCNELAVQTMNHGRRGLRALTRHPPIFTFLSMIVNFSINIMWQLWSPVDEKTDGASGKVEQLEDSRLGNFKNARLLRPCNIFSPLCVTINDGPEFCHLSAQHLIEKSC